jgi:hypothetical protein
VTGTYFGVGRCNCGMCLGVDQFVASPAAIADAARNLVDPEGHRGPRSNSQAERIRSFEALYCRDITAALGPACRGLFELNCFAKHEECGWRQKQEIYGLKDRFIRLLYEKGFCRGAWRDGWHQAARICWVCGGTGDSGTCDHCDGSGEFLPARTLWFAGFRFVIGNAAYIWHQPMDRVKFAVEYTEGERNWEPTASVPPVFMNLRERRAAKDLLWWVLARAEAGER